jgi:hypothetical protein
VKEALKQEWYRLNAISTKEMSPRDLGFHVGLKAGILKALNILAAEEHMTDKGYEVSTHEKQQEFARKRNYHYTNTTNPIDFPECWCHTCRPITISDMRMILCPDCGNKRCPKATHHDNTCTNSNEPNQPGSCY